RVLPRNSRIVPSNQYHCDHYEAVEVCVLHKEAGVETLRADMTRLFHRWAFTSFSGGMEYVEVACATRFSSPSDLIAMSPTARRFPSLISRHSASSAPRAGLRRKLMLRFVVTTSGTQPIEARRPT